MTTVRYSGYEDGQKRTVVVEYDDLDRTTITREALEDLLIGQSRPYSEDTDDD